MDSIIVQRPTLYLTVSIMPTQSNYKNGKHLSWKAILMISE
jgi:hypothetical protein